MKNPSIIFVVVILILVGVFALSHQLEAQTKKPVAVDLTAIERMEQLVADLDASGQTNTITKVANLVSAMQMAEYNHEASTTMTLLQQLRLGHTNEAIAMLEKQLDGNLVAFGAMTNEIRDAELNVLKQVKEYRTNYPHKAVFPYTDAELAQTFDLLNKK